MTTPINPKPPTVTLTTDKTSYNAGDTVILTATLQGMSPTLAVTFKLNGNVLDTVNAVSGVAQYQTTAVNNGDTVINAVWTASVTT